MAVVSVIIGILTAIFVPNMLSMSRKNELQSATNQVVGTLREAQRAAIRNGSTCTVIINPTNTTASVAVSSTWVSVGAKTVSGRPVGCITSPVTLGSAISFANPTAASTVSFSYKGNPSNTSDLTLVLGATGVSEQRCIVVSTGIGIMRSGTYSGTTCTASF